MAIPRHQPFSHGSAMLEVEIGMRPRIGKDKDENVVLDAVEQHPVVLDMAVAEA